MNLVHEVDRARGPKIPDLVGAQLVQVGYVAGDGAHAVDTASYDFLRISG